MNRTNRIALLAAAALLVAATGTVLATRAPNSPAQPAQLTSSHEAEPQTEAEDAPPTAEELARIVDRLDRAGVAADPAQVADLAERHGVGGAIRVLAWAAAAGVDVAEIERMRAGDGTEEGAVGWGQIAKDLEVHPGLGSILGNGGGHGRENAPGQQDRGEGDGSGE